MGTQIKKVECEFVSAASRISSLGSLVKVFTHCLTKCYEVKFVPAFPVLCVAFMREKNRCVKAKKRQYRWLCFEEELVGIL